MNDLNRDSPLYLSVARILQRRIADGEYPIGSLLPTEVELATSLGVSRQTVRQAMQLLRQQKLVSARKGVGTRVEAKNPERAYYYSLQSLVEIFQFASEAVLHVLSEEEVDVRGRMADELGSRPGKTWLHLVGYRKIADETSPLCWTEVHVDGRFSQFLRNRDVHQAALFSLIERNTGEAVVEVQQDITATILDEQLASVLMREPGSPALQISRRYFASGRRLLERSVNIHPADRFSYSISLKRDVPQES